MDPTLYKAAMDGNIEDLRGLENLLGIQFTTNKSSVLHVAAQFHDIREFVQEILNLKPSLIRLVNSKHETVLHIAARNGHSNTVREVIGQFPPEEDPRSRVTVKKQFLRMSNRHGDTALHEAARNNHLDVVKILIDADPEFSYRANNFGETPLYIAAKEHHHDIVSKILATCESPALGGPNGKTALHAAVISRCADCTGKLLQKFPNLTMRADQDGWKPIHHAANLSVLPCAMQFLEADNKSMAYVTGHKDHSQTALHLAAREGHTEMMQRMLSKYPDCWEMEDSRGRNILQIAVEHEKVNVINFILNNFNWSSNLENQMDNDGHAPFNLPTASDNIHITDLITRWRKEKKGCP